MTALQWLACTILLTLLGAFPYVVQRTLALGLRRSLGNPGVGDDAEMAPWSQRAKRAHGNAVENLVLFAPALIAAYLVNPQAPTLALAAPVYFLARLTHYIAYLAGVPVVRTLAHLVGLGATVAVAATLFQ